jgi:hypothetical protein
VGVLELGHFREVHLFFDVADLDFCVTETVGIASITLSINAIPETGSLLHK